MTKLIRCLPFVALTLGLLASVQAQTSYPMITHSTPTAVQRGKATDVVVEGQMNFFGAYKVLVEGKGVNIDVLEAPPPAPPAGQKPTTTQSKLKITVAPDATLGVREFRIASTLGLSSVGQLVVVDSPVVLEKEPNANAAQAQPIAVPCTVCGKIEAEDVDMYKFHAEAGQTCTFEVYCARIQDKIHDLQKHADPMLTLYDAEGRELAANDDFYFADPLLSYSMTKTGDYYIQVRDSKYEGDRRWVYALVVTNTPYISNVYPMAGNPKQTIEVEPVGSAKLKQPKAKLTVPTEIGLTSVQLDIGGIKTNPTAFVVSPLPQVLEVEPNDTPEQATRVTIPCGINGRIGVRRDLDHFVFAGTKGKAIHFEVKSRRFGTVLQSSLDSNIDILSTSPAGKAKAPGQVLASNDDTFGKDASLVFTPQADGDYILRIRDLNSKGGETYVYWIEADWALPDFTLRCDPDKAMMGPGTSAAWYIVLTRNNGFTGPVSVDVKGLPKGVTASPLTIGPAMTQGVIVVSAATDAPRDAAIVELVGKGTVTLPDGKEQTITRIVTPNQEIYNPGGGRARFDVNMQAVAVTEPSDIIKVEISPKEITLKPGEEVKIDVTIQRRGDYDKTVNIDATLNHLGQMFGNPLPPGVTIDAKSKTALGTGNKGHITLKAAPNAAPIDKVPICVLAHVSINFVVKVSYSSPAILVSVQK